MAVQYSHGSWRRHGGYPIRLNPTIGAAQAAAEPAAVIKPAGNLPLFEITELNDIDDRMTRGMAKKIFFAGKRAGMSRMEVIVEIRETLNSAGKLDESTATVLAKLESGN